MLFLHAYLFTMYVVPIKAEDGVWCPETRVRQLWASNGSCELNPHPVQDQQVSLTTEPSFQLQCLNFHMTEYKTNVASCLN